MIDDKPTAHERFMHHDTIRLYTGLIAAGCEPEQARRVTVEVIAARWLPDRTAAAEMRTARQLRD